MNQAAVQNKLKTNTSMVRQLQLQRDKELRLSIIKEARSESRNVLVSEYDYYDEEEDE